MTMVQPPTPTSPHPTEPLHGIDPSEAVELLLIQGAYLRLEVNRAAPSVRPHTFDHDLSPFGR